MDEQKQKLIDRINQAQNILVTVSANPSVDQLASAIGLTLVLNQMDKHGTAVFSGAVPSTIEFLKPEDTLEKNTDSLRDFIIALDKSKADKLRYKVEDQVVRIFITPYKTSLSQNDLEFSQGDFNVDVVLCLGVNDQQDLDAAITAHGRILHDATVVSVSATGQGNLGSINWVDPNASSLSEMMVALTDGLSKKAMNNQVATAYLTGIVASTERFRNDKTTPKTMSAAAALMAAGANQQLIATELETKPEPPPEPVQPYQPDQNNNRDEHRDEPPKPEAAPPHKAEPGTLEINHEHDAPEPDFKPEEKPPEPEHPQIHVDENGELIMPGDEVKPQPPPEQAMLPPPPAIPSISHVRGVGANGQATESDSNPPKDQPKVEVHRELMTKMPELGTPNITANTEPEDQSFDPPSEELTLPALDAPLLSHNESVLPSSMPGMTPPPAPQMPSMPFPPAPPQPQPYFPPQQAAPTIPKVADDETLTEIEQSVSSPHLHANDTPPVAQLNDARSAVEAALNGAASSSDPLQPIAALNAQPLGPELQHNTPPAPAPSQQPYIPPANLFSPTPASPGPINTGFSEPTPGTTPADDTLDMPMPGAAFGSQPANFGVPGMNPAPAAAPATGMNMGGQAPPPVPPPMLPPLQ
jgi:hypothetical protein